MEDKPVTLRPPAGLSESEEVRWWDEHWDEWFNLADSEPEDIEFVDAPGPGQMARLPNLRLPKEMVDAIYDLAVERGTTRPELIRTWLQERLNAERQALPKKASKLKH